MQPSAPGSVADPMTLPSETTPEALAGHDTSAPGGSGPKARVEGLDLARGLAVLGMVLVNFDLALGGGGQGPSVSSLAQGRASALFVLLAGVGIWLITRSRGTGARLTLMRRGAVLLGGGLLLFTVWPADILHFYGLWFLIAGLLAGATARTYAVLGVVICFAFPVLLALGVDYERHWNFLTLEYAAPWSTDGFVRHLLFNGFHPTVPWFAFLCAGFALAPRLLAEGAPLLRIAAISGAIAAGTEAAFRALAKGAESLDEAVLLNTASMPPTPPYVVAAGATAVCVLALCLAASRHLLGPGLLRAPFRSTACAGRVALTLYVGHVLIGILPFHLDPTSPPRWSGGSVALWWFAWCTAAFAAAAFAESKGRRGALEVLFRRLGG